MTNALTKSKPLEQIESALAMCAEDKLRTMTMMERTLTLADGMAMMREGFKGEILDRMKRLANTPLGFLTDRPESGKAYHDDVIRDCVIEAMLRGAQPVGNEFNVIAGRCYLTKQYFKRQLRQWPGLTELRLKAGVPHMVGTAGGALVPYYATWKLNGTPDEIRCEEANGIDTRILVRVNASMGGDAILGKATRKMLARIFERISGSEWVDVDSEVEDATLPEELFTLDATAEKVS